MAQFNQVTFVGRLGQDPQMNYTPNGKAVTKFSIAVNRGKDSKGEELPAMWLNVVCWQQLAERANEYARKGAEVLVQGKLDTRPYKDKNNVERIAIEVIATTVQVFGSKPQSKAGFTGDDALGDLDEHMS